MNRNDNEENGSPEKTADSFISTSRHRFEFFFFLLPIIKKLRVHSDVTSPPAHLLYFFLLLLYGHQRRVWQRASRVARLFWYYKHAQSACCLSLYKISYFFRPRVPWLAVKNCSSPFLSVLAFYFFSTSKRLMNFFFCVYIIILLKHFSSSGF